jgi:hypothetical protein
MVVPQVGSEFIVGLTTTINNYHFEASNSKWQPLTAKVKFMLIVGTALVAVVSFSLLTIFVNLLILVFKTIQQMEQEEAPS